MSINNEIESVLQNITEKGSYIKFNDYVNVVNYDVILRTKLNDGDSPSQQCDNWIQKFSAITNSKWIVKNTAPSAVRILYKKSYACKDKKCDARIIIVFKKDNRNTRRNDPLIAKGLTTVIKVKFKHNHEVYCPAMSCFSNPRVENMLIAQADICKRPVTPEAIKCETNLQGFSSASENSEPEDKFVDIQFECTENLASAQITKFKCELERILTIVEGTKSIEIIHCMENLNKSLQTITTPQQFYDRFSKLLT